MQRPNRPERARGRNPLLLAASLVALAAPLALAQSATPSPVAQQLPAPCAAASTSVVDIASVKPIEQSSGSFSINSHADSIKADGVVSHMIEFAYNLHSFQIAGGPGWLTTATWEVSAKVDQPPADWSTLSNDAHLAIQRQRMAAVLAQRFALKCHPGTRELPVYNLVLAKSGSKLTPTSADAEKKGSFSSHGEAASVRMEGAGATTEQLAANLSRALGRTVIDKTGLAGSYDFTLTYANDPAAGSPAAAPESASDSASGPTIFTAIEEQLGLKLESAKGPVPVLVIDSVQKPTAN